jgi:hypothetical protein
MKQLQTIQALIVIGVIAVFATPGATAGQAETATYKFTALDTMSVDSTDSVSGADAAGIRRQADADSDGQISQAEADSMKADLKAFIENLSQGPASKFTMDDQGVKSITVNTLSIDQLVGSVNATQPVVLGAKVVLTFKPSTSTAATHTFKEVTDMEPDKKTTLTVEAPSGFTIQGATGLQGSTMNSGKTSVTGTQTGDPTVLTFEKAKSSGKSPAFELVALVGGAALVGVLVRRRA